MQKNSCGKIFSPLLSRVSNSLRISLKHYDACTFDDTASQLNGFLPGSGLSRFVGRNESLASKGADFGQSWLASTRIDIGAVRRTQRNTGDSFAVETTAITTQLPLLKWRPSVPDHYCAVVCSVARICFKDERACPTQPVILFIIYESEVRPMVSGIKPTPAFIREEVVTFAIFFHHRESIVGQVAKLIALRVSNCGSGFEVSREERPSHAAISAACLRGGCRKPQD